MLVIAKSDNAGTIYLGGSSVASDGSADAIPLNAGADWSGAVDHQQKPYYINGANTGDGAYWQILVV